MSYSRKISGADTLFEVEPERAPFHLPPYYFALMTAVLILWVVEIALGAIATAGFLLWIIFNWYGKKATSYRKKRTFSVSSAGIQFNNRVYPKENIYRIKIRNHLDRDYAVAIHNNALPAYLRMGSGVGEKIAAISFRVDMEVNGEAVVLAGGITEATAYAIVSDINRIFEW